MTDPEVGMPTVVEDHYTEFLNEQRKREEVWSSNRRANAAKKTNFASGESESSLSEVDILKEKLQSKSRECALLQRQVLDHENICKVSTKTL